jgi:AcrR family transcriptional regulator
MPESEPGFQDKRVGLADRLQVAKQRSALLVPEGGMPARDSRMRAQGQATVNKLLKAGMIELDEHGLHAIRVDDVVQRAGVSHGTFYLYFSNKDDLFRTLLRVALRDMLELADEFPVVTRNENGKSCLLKWVRKFFRVYAAHAPVFRIVVSTDLLMDEFYSGARESLFAVAEAVVRGMTAASQAAGGRQEHVELKAVACLMMLEGVNLLMSNEVSLPEAETSERIAGIMFDVFAPDRP